MQALVRDPMAQGHVMAALWGQSEVDVEPVISNDGHLTQQATPWAREMWRAAELLMHESGRMDMVDDLAGRVGLLGTPEFADRCVLLDKKVMRKGP